MHAPRILVTDAGRGSAISIIRSLGQRGMHVIAADSRRLSPGFYSRYTSAHRRYADPVVNADASVTELAKIAREDDVDLIIPVTDEVLLPLSRHRDEFEGVSVLALPEPTALETASDKMKTAELARELSVPTPRSVLVSTVDDALRHAVDFEWPVVIKPQASRVIKAGGAIEAFGVAYAESEAVLEQLMRRFEGRSSVVLQEYCAGEGHGVGVLADRGRLLAAFQHRRLREVPSTGGPSSFRESVQLDPACYEYSSRLLGALSWTGLAMVEFKLGPDGPKLMEINGRIWGSFALAQKSGLDLAGMLVELYLMGLPESHVGPNVSYQVGVRSRDLRLELSWIASTFTGRTRNDLFEAPSRRDALRVFRALARSDDGFDVLSRDDPLPGLAEIVGLTGRALSKVRLQALATLARAR
jgi:predicted ATP-grasp superfamily ATP-dependent carboligase